MTIDTTKVETFNFFFVSSQGDNIVILRPPTFPMSRELAVNLAAHLLALSTCSLRGFIKVYDDVCNT